MKTELLTVFATLAVACTVSHNAPTPDAAAPIVACERNTSVGCEPACSGPPSQSGSCSIVTEQTPSGPTGFFCNGTLTVDGVLGCCYVTQPEGQPSAWRFYPCS